MTAGSISSNPIVHGLLAAQVTWLSERDPAALRRKLVGLLAELG
jgi:hypothetical protein